MSGWRLHCSSGVCSSYGMPACKKCGVPFRNRIKIGCKVRVLNRRKYCLACSPFDAHNTSKLHVKEAARIGDRLKCSRCLKPYAYARNGCTLTHCNSCVVLLRHLRVKEKAVHYLGGRCWVCGYDRCVKALDFHHLSRNGKDFSISGNANRRWSVVERELKKCALLCCRCHREVEAGFTACPVCITTVPESYTLKEAV